MTNVNDAKLWPGLSISHPAADLSREGPKGASREANATNRTSRVTAGAKQIDIRVDAGVPAKQRTARRTFRESASIELAERASSDARITAIATTVDADFVRPWHSMPQRMLCVESGVPLALEWCGSLALEGGRPFVFLSLGELLGGLGQLRDEICLKRACVTMIVEPGVERDPEEVLSAAGLAGIRQLPHLAVMSPKDGAELCQMIAWCTTHEGPALIWLPAATETAVQWQTGPPVELGRAEQLRGGNQVTIVAWGSTVSAATIATQCLAEIGIEACVVNARFAQPMDRQTIAQAVQGSLCTVLVDDADKHGGFSSWVLDHLLRIGITQPVTIVAPDDRAFRQNPSDALERCALRIVEQCRWLVEPVNDGPDLPTASNLPPQTAETGTVSVWHVPPPMSARRKYDDQRQVLAQQFSTFIEHWIAQYETVGTRDVYLWRWCLHGLELTMLPCVVPELRAHVRDTKLLSIILCVLLDDVADEHGAGRLLSALLEMAHCGTRPSWQGLSPAEKKHATITQSVWETYWERVASYPAFAKYEPVLRYDLLQFFNTMRYSYLVNSRPYLLNMAEHNLYTSHNMMMISFATLDLMCSPGFPQADVGRLREAVWHAQCMGRIGNLLSTWKRELAGHDFTSGVFARAISEGDLTLDDLERDDEAQLDTVIHGRGHLAYFFNQWHEHRRRCHALARRIDSVDLTPVLNGHDRFFAMHLESTGLI